MTTYYVRHDGTQTDKGLATVGGAAGNALSLAGFNGESFDPGDTIVFENSGVYTDVIEHSGTGTAAQPITIQGSAPGNRARVEVSGSNGITATGVHLHVRNFNIDADSNKCVFVGDDSYVEVFDCFANNSDGDGFGTGSTADDTSTMICHRCKTDTITGAANQGFTHHVDQYMKLIDCETTANTNVAVAATSTQAADIIGGTFLAIEEAFLVTSGCDVTVSNASIHATTAATSAVYDLGGSNSTITFNNCNVEHGANSTGNNAHKADGCDATFNGGRFVYSGTGTSGFEYTNPGQGVLRFAGAVIQIKEMGARVWRNNLAGGGTIQVEGCIIDLSGVAISALINVFEFRNTGSGDADDCRFNGNLVVGPTAGLAADNCSFFRLNNNVTAVCSVHNNTFYGWSGSGAEIMRDDTSSATADFDFKNNLYIDCTGVYSGSDSVTSDNNAYVSGTPAAGDTVEYTDPVEFVDADSGDFRLLSGSAYETRGAAVSPDLVGPNGEPFPSWDISMGAYQSKTVPSHPTKI